MEHIWAPWRIEYVTRPKHDGCVLCAKAEAEDDEAEGVLCRGQHNFVVVNAYPYNAGHLMIVPYEHTGDFLQLDREVVVEMMIMAQACVRALTEELYADGVNIGMNVGEAAGVGIEGHIHLHLVPRWKGDTNFMTACADMRVVPEALHATAMKLRPCISRTIEAAGIETVDSTNS